MNGTIFLNNRLQLNGLGKVGNTYVFNMSNHRGLYAVSFDTGEVTLIDEMKQCVTNLSYGNILSYKNKAILVPCMEKEICIYDIEKKSSTYVQIPVRDVTLHGDSNRLFFNGVVQGDELFLFGYAFPGIFVYNLITGETEIIDDWYDEKWKYNIEDGFFHMKFYKEGTKVFFPFVNSNAVLEFDLDLKTSTVHAIGANGQGFFSVEKIEDIFYLIPRNAIDGALIGWNYSDSSVSIYDCFPNKFQRIKHSFYRSLVKNGKLIMFAHEGNMNVMFDPATKEMVQYDDIYDTSGIVAGKYSAMYTEGSVVRFLCPKGAITWNLISDEVKMYEYQFPGAVINQILEDDENEDTIKKFKFAMRKGPIMENNGFRLDTFIRYIGL